MDHATLLRTERRRAGLSQRALAQRAGTSAAAVCLYERGERVPRTDTLARLLAATGATLTLGARRSPEVDVAANGRTLEDLLEFADHLPQRHEDELPAPFLRSTRGVSHNDGMASGDVGTPTLEALRSRRDELLSVAARHGATDLRVFGSVARGDQRAGSDVDVLVRFERGRSLLDQVHLINDLTELLGVPVDVVAEGGLLARDDHIRREAVAV